MALTNSKHRSGRPRLLPNTQNSVYTFYGEQLGRDINDSPRVIEDVVSWFEFILIVFDPTGDWDMDTVSNQDDLDPFGLLDE